MSREVKIRAALPGDAEELLEIYAPYVEHTAVSFEYAVPSVDVFRDRIEARLEKYPYLAAEAEGEIIGYAYTSPFIGRAAYGWSAETTIYLRRDSRRKGVGRLLYGTLEKISVSQNILNLNACIGFPKTEDEYLGKDSVEFHRRMGYQMAGVFHNSGYKFGRWYHMVWMEKIIGEHKEKPERVIPFTGLEREILEKCGVSCGR